VTDRTQANRTVRTSPILYRVTRTSGGRLLVVCIGIVIALAIGIGSYAVGRSSASADLAAANTLNQQLQAEGQKYKREVADQGAKINAMQAKITSIQATLDTIMPTQNTYNVSPNQSLIVGDGHLTIALIGSPSNEGVTISINGKQQSASAGQIISVAVNPSMTCLVGIQSFDMFRAILTASCPQSKTK